MAKPSVLALFKSAARILFIAYAGILLVLYFQQDAMLFPVPEQRSELPQIAGLIQSTVTTPDREALPAWHIPAQGTNPTILFFHGNGDQINSFAFLAERFAASGFGFAAVEYRGYPGASGEISEAGIMIDGLAAFDWIQETCLCEIVLMAHSLGTGVAVHVAAERDAHALALFAPYSSIADVAANRFWFLPVRLLIKNAIHSDRRIGNVTEPVLMVHGNADTTIPIQFGRRLFDLANEPKQFIELNFVGHNQVLDGSVGTVLKHLSQ
jgi:uncharacterized protein